jgi:sugar lactone lactonase YvrE
MSLDRRLREGLERSSSSVEERELDAVLAGIVVGARRRRLVRRAVAAAIILALGLGAIVLGPRALDALRSERSVPAFPGSVSLITTIAGNGVRGSAGDGGPATAAQLAYPLDLAFGADGSLFIMEFAGRRVRRVDSAGRISTVLAAPDIGYSTALTSDADGNIYVGGGKGDRFMVTRIDLDGGLTTVAGTGERGFSGDGESAIDATFGWIYDLALDREGNLYIVDHSNNRIRMVDTSGIVRTIAGTGNEGFSGDGGPAVEAELDHPDGIFVDVDGTVYVADAGNDRVRRIDRNGIITTVAGTGRPGYSGDSGAATEAQLKEPEHVWVDANENLYILDTGNQVVRLVDRAGTITTIVGTGERGSSGDGGPATGARLNGPSGMILGPDGALYIADSNNDRIRKVTI